MNYWPMLEILSQATKRRKVVLRLFGWSDIIMMEMMANIFKMKRHTVTTASYFSKKPKMINLSKLPLFCQNTQGYLELPENITYLTILIILSARNVLKLFQIWSKPIKCNKEYFSSLELDLPFPFRQI